MPNMPDSKILQAIAELESLAHRSASTSEERYRVLEARDRHIRLTTERTTDIRKAQNIVGICPDMCPEKERYLREWKSMVPSYERHPATGQIDHTKAIKQYSRSSADQELPLPHELRTEQALGSTMYYLLANHADRIDGPSEEHGTANISDWFHYIWDRTRGIRKDITQQDLCSLTVVELVQQCTRFHIYCAARFVMEDPSVFDQKINTENLTKCLQTLKYMYADLKQQNVVCPDEPEFRAYMMLLYLNEGNYQAELRELSDTTIHSSAVQFALSVHLALVQNNYVRFFHMVRQASYMNACILLRYFTQMRLKAIDVIRKAYALRSMASFKLSYLTETLGFDDEADAVGFFEHFGVAVDRAAGLVLFEPKHMAYAYQPEHPYAARRSLVLVESKRTCPVGEAICGAPLHQWGSQFPPVPCVNSFDERGFLHTQLLEEVFGRQHMEKERNEQLPDNRNEDGLDDLPQVSPDMEIFADCNVLEQLANEPPDMDRFSCSDASMTDRYFFTHFQQQHDDMSVGYGSKPVPSQADQHDSCQDDVYMNSSWNEEMAEPNDTTMNTAPQQRASECDDSQMHFQFSVFPPPAPVLFLNTPVSFLPQTTTTQAPSAHPPSHHTSYPHTPSPHSPAPHTPSAHSPRTACSFSETAGSGGSSLPATMSCNSTLSLHSPASEGEVFSDTLLDDSSVVTAHEVEPHTPEQVEEAGMKSTTTKKARTSSLQYGQTVADGDELFDVASETHEIYQQRWDFCEQMLYDLVTDEVLGEMMSDEIGSAVAAVDRFRASRAKRLAQKYAAMWMQKARLRAFLRRAMTNERSPQMLPIERVRAVLDCNRGTSAAATASAMIADPALRKRLLPFESFCVSDLIDPFAVLATAVQKRFQDNLLQLRAVQPLYWKLLLSVPSELDCGELKGFPSFIERYVTQCSFSRNPSQNLADQNCFFLEARKAPLFDGWAARSAICMRLLPGTEADDAMEIDPTQACVNPNGMLVFLHARMPRSEVFDRLQHLIISCTPFLPALAIMVYHPSTPTTEAATVSDELRAAHARIVEYWASIRVSVRVFQWTNASSNGVLREALNFLADSYAEQCKRLAATGEVLEMLPTTALLNRCIGSELWFRWQSVCHVQRRLMWSPLATLASDANALVLLYTGALRRVLRMVDKKRLCDHQRVSDDFNPVRELWRQELDSLVMISEHLSEGFFSPDWLASPAFPNRMKDLFGYLCLRRLPDELLKAVDRAALSATRYHMGIDTTELTTTLSAYLATYGPQLSDQEQASLMEHLRAGIVTQLAGCSFTQETLQPPGSRHDPARCRQQRYVYWIPLLRSIADSLLHALLHKQVLPAESYFINAEFTKFITEAWWEETKIYQEVWSSMESWDSSH